MTLILSAFEFIDTNLTFHTIPGISRAYGGTLSSLEILYTLIPRDELSKLESQTIPENLKDSNKVKNLWLEREIVSALYEDRKEVLVQSERFLDLPW